jgi:flagellum-specific peptidoglycan hydrolase FlgJ
VSKYCSPEYDPRHFDNVHKYYTGDTSLGFLNGRWATDANYADKIAQFANEIYGN